MSNGQAQNSTVKKLRQMMKKDGKEYFQKIVEKNNKLRQENPNFPKKK
ncbi:MULTISPECIES: hypothetical protein [Bacillus cereus group]|nr:MULTISPECIES: hypothetical protein [Bacillus cereus group]